MESEKLLIAENERLQSQLTTMKKKVKLAMKKQLAELQSKIQDAEQRALAAEAALAGVNGHVSGPTSGNGVNGEVSSSSLLDLLPSKGASPVLRERLSFVDSSDGEIVHPLSLSADEDFLNFQSSYDILPAELKPEKEHSRERDDEVATETQRLENEVIELRKAKDAVVKQKEEERAKFEEELRLVKEDAERRVGLLNKANEKLETQLMGAAGQVSEAFTRMSATQDDMERISREGNEVKRAHSTLASEHESLKKELEQTRSSLAEMQKKFQDKTKEMEEMAAARRAAQEGQEAAMSQLILRLDEMEAAGSGQGAELHLRELNEDRVQSLLQEKEELLKELERSSQTLSNLRDEVAAHRKCTGEHSVQGVGPLDPNEVDYSRSDLKTCSPLHEQIKSPSAEADSMQRGQKTEFISVQELSSLTEELQESRAIQQAAESKIKHLSSMVSEAEKRVLTLSQELAEVHRQRGDEIKLRDDNYVQLEAKFGRLQKRAKQRIQEVQKEKEEVETQLSAAVEKASQALSRQAGSQDDLDRARIQAGEALRTLDAERQQLRAANIKLREEVEDLRRALDGKEQDLAESHQAVSEKEQAVVDMTAMLREVEASHESAVSDLKDKYQRMEENFKSQLSDATSETSKMVETISALQAQLGVKESKLAELDAASSGEVVRLNASLEAAKGDVSRLELEHKKEKDAWQVSLEKLQRKLEDSEKVIHEQEVDTAGLRNQLESELEQQRRLLIIAREDISTARNETERIASDFAAYKIRAYSLLQKKEAELLAAKDSELAAAQETALKNAKREAAIAVAERESAVKALRDAVSEYEIKLAARDVSLLDAEQRIRDLATKLEASKGQLLAEQDEWQSRLEQIEAMKRDSTEGSISSSVEADLRHENTELLKDYNNLKEEFDSFRNLVDTMVEEKDKEVARLLEDNANLQRSSSVEPKDSSEKQNTNGKAAENPDLDSAVIAVAEQQILLLARQQAQREEEVSQCRRHIQALQEEIVDLEHENRLRSQQEALLKEEFRNLERAHKRDGVDMTYLKNVILKLLETGEVEALLPVVAMLLQFSPEELKRCHDTYSTATTNNVPLSAAAAVIDSTVSTPRSFFSRLNFTGGN